jgi:hypothetical protein
LEEIEGEVATLRRLAARGMGDRVASLVADLEAERQRLAEPPQLAEDDLDPSVLRALVEARVRDLRGAFEGAPEECRAALRALLGGRRMRVLPDPEQRFRVEGLFELSLETTDSRSLQGTGSLHSVVAGGRYATGEHLPRELAFPLAA